MKKSIIIIFLTFLFLFGCKTVNAQIVSTPPVVSTPDSVSYTPVTFTYPGVGDVLTAGSTYTISWVSNRVPNEARLQSVRLVIPALDYSSATIFLAGTVTPAFRSTKPDFSVNDSFTWTIPKGIHCEECYITGPVLSGDYRTNSNYKNFGWGSAGPFKIIESNQASNGLDLNHKPAKIESLQQSSGSVGAQVLQQIPTRVQSVAPSEFEKIITHAPVVKKTFGEKVANFFSSLKFW